MYRWRSLTPEQREELLQLRERRGHPSHSVPHIVSDTTTYYLVTAACYEHSHVIGFSSDRMAEFESRLLEVLNSECDSNFAWNVLPNHYHALVDVPDISSLLKQLGQLHGRTSFLWNGEDAMRGRQVWCNAAETVMKSEGHYYASLNYVLNNAVHHGYVSRWTDWPFSNVAQYLEKSAAKKHCRFGRTIRCMITGKTGILPNCSRRRTCRMENARWSLGFSRFFEMDDVLKVVVKKSG